MSLLARKLRRLREAASVSAHRASIGDRVTRGASDLRLLVRPPTRHERTIGARIGTVVHSFAFRKSDTSTLGEIVVEQQDRLPTAAPAA